MRTIDKQGEPTCLAALRREVKRTENETNKPPKGRDWDPGGCADPIRESLHAEQGGLCAYCMGRITQRGYRSELHHLGGMKIEHWLDRSTHPRHMYDWDNLLGVCGGEYRGPAGLVEHCDTSRGSTSLHVHPGTPTPPRPEDVFSFERTPPESYRGRVRRGMWIHAADSGAIRDIRTLNLNADHLVKNRHSAVEALRLALQRSGRSGDSAIRAVLRRRLTTATRPGPHGLPPFAPLIAAYVRKKMRAKDMDPP